MPLTASGTSLDLRTSNISIGVIARPRFVAAFLLQNTKNKSGETGTRTRDTMIFGHVRHVPGVSDGFETRLFVAISHILRCYLFQVVSPGYCQIDSKP